MCLRVWSCDYGYIVWLVTYTVSLLFSVFFFFFKQKTAYEMRISDWSSDVCSSDLVPAGVDDAAKVKASYLAAIALGKETCSLIDRKHATELLGTMLGGYNISPLIELIDNAEMGTVAAETHKKTLMVIDALHEIKEKDDKGNTTTRAFVKTWAK